MPFRDRSEAGRRLAKALAACKVGAATRRRSCCPGSCGRPGRTAGFDSGAQNWRFNATRTGHRRRS
jgi:hypothetical protein